MEVIKVIAEKNGARYGDNIRRADGKYLFFSVTGEWSWQTLEESDKGSACWSHNNVYLSRAGQAMNCKFEFVDSFDEVEVMLQKQEGAGCQYHLVNEQGYRLVVHGDSVEWSQYGGSALFHSFCHYIASNEGWKIVPEFTKKEEPKEAENPLLGQLAQLNDRLASLDKLEIRLSDITFRLSSVEAKLDKAEQLLERVRS